MSPTTDALARFGITAATLAAFSMVQLLVYAALQVPVGVLIDRYGSRRLIVLGSLVMAGAQGIFAFSATLPVAFAARVVLGIGDALVFISVMRLVPAWFPPERSAKLTNATGPVNQLGFVLSAVGFSAVLAAAGWTPVVPVRGRGQRRVGGAGAPAAARLAARRARRASRSGRRSPRPAAACARRGRSRAPASGFWLGFMALFTGMTFGVMWGYPFLTLGQGLSPGDGRRLDAGVSLSPVWSTG